jgi:hypothetical protein
LKSFILHLRCGKLLRRCGVGVARKCHALQLSSLFFSLQRWREDLLVRKNQRSESFIVWRHFQEPVNARYLFEVFVHCDS